MFTALLDTCVLWPSLQRDFLLSLAVEGMYRPVWSAAILAEFEYHETTKLVRQGENEDKAAVRARFLIEQMRSDFDDAEVHGWEGLEGTYGLPDPSDEHVAAAAVVAGSGAIVTHNLKDFPQSRLPNGINVISPAEFAASTVELEPVRAFNAVLAIAERSGRKGPPVSVDDVLTAIAAATASSGVTFSVAPTEKILLRSPSTREARMAGCQEADEYGCQQPCSARPHPVRATLDRGPGRFQRPGVLSCLLSSHRPIPS